MCADKILFRKLDTNKNGILNADEIGKSSPLYKLVAAKSFLKDEDLEKTRRAELQKEQDVKLKKEQEEKEKKESQDLNIRTEKSYIRKYRILNLLQKASEKIDALDASDEVERGYQTEKNDGKFTSAWWGDWFSNKGEINAISKHVGFDKILWENSSSWSPMHREVPVEKVKEHFKTIIANTQNADVDYFSPKKYPENAHDAIYEKYLKDTDIDKDSELGEEIYKTIEIKDGDLKSSVATPTPTSSPTPSPTPTPVAPQNSAEAELKLYENKSIKDIFEKPQDYPLVSVSKLEYDKWVKFEKIAGANNTLDIVDLPKKEGVEITAGTTQVNNNELMGFLKLYGGDKLTLEQQEKLKNETIDMTFDYGKIAEGNLGITFPVSGPLDVSIVNKPGFEWQYRRIQDGKTQTFTAGTLNNGGIANYPFYGIFDTYFQSQGLYKIDRSTGWIDD